MLSIQDLTIHEHENYNAGNNEYIFENWLETNYCLINHQIQLSVINNAPRKTPNVNFNNVNSVVLFHKITIHSLVAKKEVMQTAFLYFFIFILTKLVWSDLKVMIKNEQPSRTYITGEFV